MNFTSIGTLQAMKVQTKKQQAVLIARLVDLCG
jgi:hypothetical protein